MIGSVRASVGGRSEGLSEFPGDYAWDSQGRLLLTQPDRSGVPLVFDPRSGDVRPIGRSGQGPGEFKRVTALATLPGDTVVMFDRGNRRLTFLAPDFRYLRDAPAPLHTYSMLWWPGAGALVVNAAIRDAARVGVPHHLFDRRGSEIRSFGGMKELITPSDDGSSLMRALGIDEAGRLLSVRRLSRFEIEAWSTGDQAPATWQSDSPAMRSTGARSSARELNPPEPWVAWVGSRQGVVLVLIRVPDPRWRNGITVRPYAGGGERGWMVERIDPTRYHDTIVEALDLVSGVLLARTRLDHACRSVSPRTELACEAENADGSFRVDLIPIGFIR